MARKSAVSTTRILLPAAGSDRQLPLKMIASACAKEYGGVKDGDLIEMCYMSEDFRKELEALLA